MNARQFVSILPVCAIFALHGCSSSSSTPPPPPPPPPADYIVSGIVSDGAVSGGSVYAFTAEQVQAALDALTPGGDRAAELAAQNPIASQTRAVGDGDQYQLVIGGIHADRPVFLVFDNGNAEDDVFGDTPPNLESVAMGGAAGSTIRVNITLHTTMIGQQVRAQLDPDGDGAPIDDAAIETARLAASMSVLEAFGQDELGRPLFPESQDPTTTVEDEVNHAASTSIGRLVRTAAAVTELSYDEVIEALALDAGDNDIDGEIPAIFDADADTVANAMAVDEVESAGDGDEYAAFAQGPCSSAAVELRRACAVDVLDDAFETGAACLDTSDQNEEDECVAEARVEFEEENEFCDEVFDARLELCESLGDAAHDPEFGEEFADNFVDPTEIGTTVTPNPYFPLVAGNRWVYESEEETITVEVLAATKLIDGITCVTVKDVVSVDGVPVEDTDDWFAQDLDGNIWYCGEISENFEVFEGDDPAEAELVDIDGSWKSGRDEAEAGVLLPAGPVVGDVIRQEVAYGEAEDAIEIVSITATETAPAGACAATCLQTLDFTPVEPGDTADKFYAPGIGLIVELEEGERVELVEFTQGMP